LQNIQQKLSESIKGLCQRQRAKSGRAESLRCTYGKLLGAAWANLKKPNVFFEELQSGKKTPIILKPSFFALGLLALESEDGQTAKIFFSQLLQMG